MWNVAWIIIAMCSKSVSWKYLNKWAQVWMCIHHGSCFRLSSLQLKSLKIYFWSCSLLPKRNWCIFFFFFKMLLQWALFLAEVLHWTCSHLSLTPLKMLLVHTSWCSQHHQPSKWLQPTIPMKMGLALTMVSGSLCMHRAQLFEQNAELEYGVTGLPHVFCL